MYDLKLDHVCGAAMITVLGPLDATSVPDFDEVLSVLDAEAVVIVNLLACLRMSDDAVDVLLMLERLRNGRFVIVAESHSQPRFAVEARAGRLQIVSTVDEATIRAMATAELAYHLFRSCTGLATAERPRRICSPRINAAPGTRSHGGAKRARLDCMKLIR